MLRFQPISIGFQNFLLVFGRSGIFYSGLSGGQPGNRHPEGGAGDVGEANVVAEVHRGGVSALLAADAQLDVRAGLAAQLAGHLHQTAHAHLVQTGEGIGLVDLPVIVAGQELARIVAAEAEGHLGQIVGAEGEELRLLGDVIGGEGGAGDLNHGAHLVGHVAVRVADKLPGHLVNGLLHIRQLLGLANQGNHDLRHNAPRRTAGADRQSGLDDGGSLHLGDLRVGDIQAAAPVAHHGVELVEAVDGIAQVLLGDAHLLGQGLDIGLIGGQELVERRIQQADGDRPAHHGLVDLLKVLLLHGLQLGQGPLPLLHGLGHDHLPDGGNALGIKEHVLRAAQADALRAEVLGLPGVLGGVGVGADLQGAELVRPVHNPLKLAGDLGLGGVETLAVDVAGGAVQADPVALLVGLAAQSEALVDLVHDDLAAAGDAAGAHASGHHGGVAGHAAPDGEDAPGKVHALDVLGTGLQADQDHLVALVHPLHHVVSGEHHLSCGGAGGGGQALADGGHPVQLLLGEGGVEEAVQALGVDHGHGLFLGNHALVHQIAGDLQGGGGGALAVAGLEHEQLLVLNGELHVLHVPVVVLQLAGDLHELLVGLGHDLGQLVDGLGGAHTGHHVLALGVHEELAEQLLLAGGGVAGEGHAGTGGVAHVAEDHLLNVDGRAPGGGDVVHAAVVDGPGVVPGAEHGPHRAHELLTGVLGELLADLLPVLVLEHLRQLLEILGGQLGIQLHVALGLHLVDELFKVLLAHLHDHVGVHLNKPAVGVVGEAGILGLLGKGLHHLVVEAQVEDGVHHAGHGGPGAGADGDQQGVVHVPELLAGHILQLGHIGHDLVLDLGVDGAPVLVVLGAGLGGDGEAPGHRHAQDGHLRQIGPLAAQQLPHGPIALGKQIHKLLVHLNAFLLLSFVMPGEA